ncbi:MAG: Snf7 family protein [Candidatus Lokiarchaeota archaeon]|nr:Snf7 family protein [Candidatus Lokiarchaeota archaeon]
MGLKKKLFPRKGEEQDKMITQAKSHIQQLSLINKSYSRKAEISRKNAKIALKRGEKDRAKNYLIQYKQYSMKVDRANNMRIKIERQLDAIQEGKLILTTGNLMGGIRDELKEIATKASPVRIAEISEDADAYVSEIEESAEILGGDLEIDLGIDVTAELNQLETEMLLDQGGAMPAIPEDDLQYIPEEDMPLEDVGTVSKEKVQAEIEKLKKELNS